MSKQTKRKSANDTAAKQSTDQPTGGRPSDDSKSSSSRRCSKSNVSQERRKRVLTSEDLRTDHVKLENPSILTKNSFLPGHWEGLG